MLEIKFTCIYTFLLLPVCFKDDHAIFVDNENDHGIGRSSDFGNILTFLNLVIWPKLPRVSCSSVVERPTGVRKVIGSTSVGRTQNFFPSSLCH